MTMISRKDFTSSDYRLFMLPAFTRAFLFKSSPSGELSYNIKKTAATRKDHWQQHFLRCLLTVKLQF